MCSSHFIRQSHLAIDNLIVAGSDQAGDIGQPVPTPGPLLLIVLGMLGLISKKRFA